MSEEPPDLGKSPDLSLYKQSQSVIGAQGRSRTGTEFNLRGILSPLRLPVSPPGHIVVVEAEAGIEPAYTALQAAA